MKKTTSLGVILDRILRDHIFDGLTIEMAIDYCIDFFHIVEVPEMFEEKLFSTKFGKKNGSEYQDYRIPLPNDYVSMIQLSINSMPARHDTSTIGLFYDELKTISNDETYRNRRTEYRRPADYAFRIQGNWLYLSDKHGSVDMVYLAVPVCDESNGFTSDDPFYGSPAIPDTPVFFRALKAYIEREFLTILWRNNKISDKVYADSEQKYAWAVGAYETDARKLDLSKAESFYNMWRTLVPRVTEFRNQFRNMGSQEIMTRR